MLLPRILTALVLVALLLPALASRQSWPFAILTLSMVGAGAWEWGRLNGLRQRAALACGVAMVAAGLLGWLAGWMHSAPSALWWLTVVVWTGGATLTLRAGPDVWSHWPRVARLGMGFLALWAAWLALASAHQRGLNFTLSILCLVWVADIAAYAGGRALGRHKLAPAISPGKSWEGVGTGIAGVLGLAGAWRLWEVELFGDSGSLFHLIAQTSGWFGLGLSLLGLAGLSVVGDLMESLAKRAAGAKDSSRLLPGHGGVLDRVDALLPVLPAAMALASIA